VICKCSGTHRGKIAVTLERDSATLVVKGVPARIFDNCGEAYVDEETSRQLLAPAQETLCSRVHENLRGFLTASA
jgi:YgiT-type zinc finger domain-containing protein